MPDSLYFKNSSLEVKAISFFDCSSLVPALTDFAAVAFQNPFSSVLRKLKLSR